MKKVFIIATFLTLAFTSCKEKDAATTDENTQKEPVKENFNVELDVVAEKEDNFALYFTEDNTINFNGEHAVWRGVKGQNQSETLFFELPEPVVPTNIRIDFGINKGDKQGDITLKKLRMSFYGKKFETNGSDFFKYFIPNDSIKTEIDQASGSIKFLKTAKQSTPFYYPQQSLIDEIKNLTK